MAKKEHRINGALEILQGDQNLPVQHGWYKENILTSEEREYLFFLVKNYTTTELKKHSNTSLTTLIKHGLHFYYFVYECCKESGQSFFIIKNYQDGLTMLRKSTGLEKLKNKLEKMSNDDVQVLFKISKTEKTFKSLYNFLFLNGFFTEINNFKKLKSVARDFAFWIEICMMIIKNSNKRFNFLIKDQDVHSRLIITHKRFFKVFLISTTLGKQDSLFTLDEIQDFLDRVHNNFESWKHDIEIALLENFSYFSEYIMTHVDMIQIINDLENGISFFDFTEIYLLHKQPEKEFGRYKYVWEKIYSSLFATTIGIFPHHEISYKNQKTLRISITNPVFLKITTDFPYLIPLLPAKNILRILIQSTRENSFEKLHTKLKTFEFPFINELNNQLNKSYSFEQVLEAFWDNDNPFGLERVFFQRDKEQENKQDSEREYEENTPQISLFNEIFKNMGFQNLCDWLLFIYTNGEHVLPRNMIADWFVIALQYLYFFDSKKRVPDIYYTYTVDDKKTRILLNENMKIKFRKGFIQRKNINSKMNIKI